MFKALADTSIVPVDELITNPAGEEVNVPPKPPVIVGVGSVPVTQ